VRDVSGDGLERSWKLFGPSRMVAGDDRTDLRQRTRWPDAGPESSQACDSSANPGAKTGEILLDRLGWFRFISPQLILVNFTFRKF
jgi:hypothetical protein